MCTTQAAIRRRSNATIGQRRRAKAMKKSSVAADTSFAGKISKTARKSGGK